MAEMNACERRLRQLTHVVEIAFSLSHVRDAAAIAWGVAEIDRLRAELAPEPPPEPDHPDLRRVIEHRLADLLGNGNEEVAGG